MHRTLLVSFCDHLVLSHWYKTDSRYITSVVMTYVPSRLDFRVSCSHTPHLWRWHGNCVPTHDQYLPDGPGLCSQVGHTGPSEQLTPTFIKFLSKQCSTRAAEAKSQFQTMKTKLGLRLTQAVPAAPLILHPSFLNMLHSAIHTSHLGLKPFFSCTTLLPSIPYIILPIPVVWIATPWAWLAASQLPLTPTEVKWGKQKQQTLFLQSPPHSLLHPSDLGIHPVWI